MWDKHIFLFLFSYPPLPICREVGIEDMSDYSRQTQVENDTTQTFAGGKRLVADLSDKQGVLIHYMYLKELLKVGAQVEVKKVLVVDQSPFMKPFVDVRKRRRDVAKDEFTSMLQKFLLNSIYGKVIDRSIDPLSDF